MTIITTEGEEGSFLPPSKRDLTNLQDVVRASARNLKALSPGFGAGRLINARLILQGGEAEDALQDGGEGGGADTQYEWQWEDRGTVADPDVAQVITLTYTPVDESLFVRWHPGGGAGVPITYEHFTLDGNVVTLPNPGVLAVGDQFSFQYQMNPGEEVAPDDNPSIYNAAVLARPNLLAFWPLNDPLGSTVTTDLSPFGRHGAYNPDVVLGDTALLTGDPDTSAEFPSGEFPAAAIPFGSWMNVPEFTIECWAATGTISNGICTWVSRDNDFRSWFFTQASGGGMWAAKIAGGGATAMTPDMDLDDTQPHMVAMTYDGAAIRLYADGVLELTVATTGDMSTSSFLAIGAGYYGFTDYWPLYHYKGRLGKVAYYSGAEPADQIMRRYIIGSTGVDPG